MKKIIAIIFLFSILFQTTIYAQVSNKVLISTNTKTRSVNELNKNKKIEVTYLENNVRRKYKGKYRVIDDETIKIYSKELKVSQIVMIKTKSSAVGAASGVLIGFGIAGTIIGMIVKSIGKGISNSASSVGGYGQGFAESSGFFVQGVGIVVIVAGVIMAIIGISANSLQDVYSTNVNCVFSIVDQEKK